MIPRNFYWIERELNELRQKLCIPGLNKKDRRKIKDKIRTREKILKEMREQLEIDIMDMEQFKSLGEKKPEPYRPSSGTEGADFCAHFCDRCKHNQDQDNPCNIWMDTWIYEIDEPEYPKEWIYKNGHPTCTKFKAKE